MIMQTGPHRTIHLIKYILIIKNYNIIVKYYDVIIQIFMI